MIGHHKSRVEAHAELADDVDFAGSLVLFAELRFELAGAAAGDGAQVGLQVLLAHAHAVVGDGQRAQGLVRCNNDLQILPLHLNSLIGERPIGQLILRIAGIGDQLPQEDLLVGIDRIDHQVQQPLGFRLELFFCHGDCLQYDKVYRKNKIVSTQIT